MRSSAAVASAALLMPALCGLVDAQGCDFQDFGLLIHQVNQVCCPDDSCDGLVPSTCNEACGNTFVDAYDHCADLMQALPGGDVYESFYTQCQSTLANSGTCQDSPTWQPQSCVNQYDVQTNPAPGQDCDGLIAAGMDMCTPGGQYEHYCDRSCGSGPLCTGCAMFEEGQVNHCKCSSYDGVHNCPIACDGWCAAEDEAVQITDSMIDRGALADGSIDSTCSPSSGRHQWFHFHALAGRVYHIHTELVQGGLTSTYIHLHAADEEGTALADAKAWHCSPEQNQFGLGASCMMWACESTGRYAVRVQQLGGSGAFKLGITSPRTVAELTDDARLSIDAFPKTQAQLPTLYMDGGAHHEDGSEHPQEPVVQWTSEFQVDCQLTYCDYHKDGEHLVSDGTGFTMRLVQAQKDYTYNFTVSLADGSAATYIRLTMVPENAQGGIKSFESREGMSKTFHLGDWGDTEDGHQTYQEFRPSYDMKGFKSFPGQSGARVQHFAWVAPATKTYFVDVKSNCDEPVLDDIQANIDLSTGLPLPGHDDASACGGVFNLGVHGADMSTSMILPVIKIVDPCTLAPGSSCQIANDRMSSTTELPHLHLPRSLQPLPGSLPNSVHHVADDVHTAHTVVEACEGAVYGFVNGDSVAAEFVEKCQIRAEMGLGLGGGRQLQVHEHGSHRIPSVEHIEVRASNHELIRATYDTLQAMADAEAERPHSHHGRRQLESPGSYSELEDAHARVGELEQMLASQRAELERLRRQNSALGEYNRYLLDVAGETQ